jgi:inositol-hexakisphosphate kinase
MSAPTIQLAGHIGAFTKLDGGRIRKLVKKEEAAFYRGLAARNLDAEILPYIPKFFGIEEHDGKEYIVIEDITADMAKPTLMDMKMGTSSVDPLTNPEKRAAMDLKDKKTTTCSLGMRVCGVNIQNIADGTVFKQGKPWGKAITVEQMPGAVKQFFHDGKKLRLDVAAHFLEDVQRILAWWTKQSVFCLYSSSLLFVFDASVENSVKAQIRVIDYAHPIDITDGSHDEGMIFGLQNLVKHLEDLIAGK